MNNITFIDYGDNEPFYGCDDYIYWNIDEGTDDMSNIEGES